MSFHEKFENCGSRMLIPRVMVVTRPFARFTAPNDSPDPFGRSLQHLDIRACVASPNAVRNGNKEPPRRTFPSSIQCNKDLMRNTLPSTTQREKELPRNTFPSAFQCNRELPGNALPYNPAQEVAVSWKHASLLNQVRKERLEGDLHSIA